MLCFHKNETFPSFCSNFQNSECPCEDPTPHVSPLTRISCSKANHHLSASRRPCLLPRMPWLVIEKWACWEKAIGSTKETTLGSLLHHSGSPPKNDPKRSGSQAPRAVLKQKSEPVVCPSSPPPCPLSSCRHDYLSLKGKNYDPGEEAHTPASPSILACSIPKAKNRSLQFRRKKVNRSIYNSHHIPLM